MAPVTLQGVRKVYPGGAEAVAGFSLEIADGEFVVLVGPSGCGKSTTLRMIAGLEEVTEGTISIGGRVVNGVHPKDRDIAMVFQNYALYPHMSVYENMAFALKLRGVARAEVQQRVTGAARILGIEGLLKRRPRELSGGQRQRVAVGRAIVREPAAFLFDEPLSNLDAALRLSTRAELKALHQRLRTTTVYVTHDQEEAMTLGDRIVVMNEGRIQQAGPPLEVYTRPVNRFVAGFVGTPAMNMIEGRVEREAAGGVFVERGGGVRIRLNGAGERLRGESGGEVVLGVRPQALSERAGAGASGTGLSIKVEVVEPLGDTMDVLGRTSAGSRVVARVAARAGLKPGESIDLAIDPAKVHCFEPGMAGRNLLLDG